MFSWDTHNMALWIEEKSYSEVKLESDWNSG